MKITFFDIAPGEKEIFSRFFSGVEVSFIEEKLKNQIVLLMFGIWKNKIEMIHRQIYEMKQ